MATNNKIDAIPHLKSGQITSYSPADIKRWGVQHFLDEVCEKDPISIPDLGFSDEENQRMDQLLEEEKKSSSNDL